MGQKYDDGQKGHDYSGKGPGNGQMMNSSSNKAYRWNNEGNLSFQILHEKKSTPPQPGFQNLEKNFQTLL